jgi:hypothetical protein
MPKLRRTSREITGTATGAGHFEERPFKAEKTCDTQRPYLVDTNQTPWCVCVYTLTMSLARYIELTERIEYVLAQPMPPPEEMHLLREDIFALVYARLGEVGGYSDVERDQLARDFTLTMVHQRIISCPIHLREKNMPARLNYTKKSAARVSKK